MKRALVSIFVALAVMVALRLPALASTHQATIGNYYYEDDQQRDRTKIVVHQGDQITFTVRDAAYPPHTVDVDELDIHSGDLLPTDKYTTPPLNKVGNFYLYCRPHEARGHHTRLIVLAPTSEVSARPTAAPRTTAVPAATGHAPATVATSSPQTPPTTTLTPVGVTRASPGVLGHPIRSDPNSVEALTGHRISNGLPWTRSLWWLLIATVPIVGAAGVALRRARVAQYQPKVENMRRIREAPPKKAGAAQKKPPPRKRKR